MNFAIAAAAILSLGFLAIDLLIPLGVAAGIPYVVVILAAWWIPNRRAVVVLAALSTIFVIIGYFYSPEAGIGWMVLANRVMTIFVIWATAILLLMARHSGHQLQQLVRQRTRELRESEQHLRLAIDNVPAMIGYVDADERFLFINQTYADWYRVPREEMVGKKVAELMGAEGYKDLAPYVKAALSGEHTTYEMSRRYPDGEFRHVQVETTPHMGEDGAVLGYHVLITNVTEHKNAEKALRESEERLAEAQRIATIGNWERIATDDELYWSHEVYRIFGLDQARFTPTMEKLFSLIHPDDLAHVKTVVREGVDSGERYSYEHRIILPDGEIKWVRQEAESYLDESGGEIHRRGTVQDMTSQKLAEDALRESEALYRNILDNMADAFYRADSEGKIVMASPSVKELLGYEVDEVVGRPIADFNVDAGEREVFLRAFAESGGNIRGHESALRRKDGRTIWVSTNARTWRGINNEILGIEGLARDITERRLTDEALSTSQKQLRAITNNLPATIAYLDAGLRFQFVNDAYERLYGLSIDKILGKVAPELIGEQTFNELAAQFDRALGGDEVAFDISRQYPSMGNRRMHFNLVPDMAPNGAAQGIYILGSDITEREQMEDQLRQAQKMEAVGQLTGGIAHDFNNLLTVIMGNLELIHDKVGGNAGVSDLVERSLKAADQGASLTHRLLAFSRKQILVPTAIDLNTLVPDMAVMMRRILGEEIEIRTECAPGLPPCRADRTQLEAALLNLSINARDALSTGGVLTIETAGVSLGDEKAAAQMELIPGDYVTLSVSDNGSGISQSALAHVFEPFFTTKEVGKGSGLGLSMVHGFSRQSGGTVTIDSELGVGTTVNIYLPRWAEQEEKTA